MFLSYVGVGSECRPSFFELIAQEKLSKSLLPALSALLSHFSERLPSLRNVAKRDIEIFYFLSFLLQKRYLGKNNASFSENFYGLVRHHPITAYGASIPFSDTDRWWSLAELVLLPYLKSKLDQFHRSHYHLLQVQNSELARELPVTERIRFLFLRAFLRLYPFVAASFTGVNLIYQLLFAFELTPFFNLIHRFLKIEIRRMTMQDMARSEKRASAISSRSSLFFRLLSFLSRFSDSFIESFKWGILISAFAIKFTDWLRESKDRLGAVESLPIPPPPPLPQSFSGTVDNRCPLCSGQITNAACAPSGFVFCYLCLFRHVSRSPFCPITRAPCSTDHIRRLYDE